MQPAQDLIRVELLFLGAQSACSHAFARLFHGG